MAAQVSYQGAVETVPTLANLIYSKLESFPYKFQRPENISIS